MILPRTSTFDGGESAVPTPSKMRTSSNSVVPSLSGAAGDGRPGISMS